MKPLQRGIVRAAALALLALVTAGGRPEHARSVTRISPAALLPAAAAVSVIYRFSGGGDLEGPEGNLAAYGGALYGTSNQASNGNVFVLTKTGPTWSAASIYQFRGMLDGYVPFGVIADSNGVLYGSTYEGGKYSYGTVYKLVKSGASYKHTILHNMKRTDGSGPLLLTMDAGGAIYGTSQYGGISTACGTAGCGTVFKLAPSGGSFTYRVLRSFKGGTDGQSPTGQLVIAQNGTVYGVTEQGGTVAPNCALGCGTIFALTPSGGSYTYTVPYRFKGGADGYSPEGGLTFGATAQTQGTLYGITRNGGATNCGGPCGTLFSFSSTKKKTILHKFMGPGSNDGSDPFGGIVATPSGLLGTTSEGGDQSKGATYGTAWSLSYAGTYAILRSFVDKVYGTDSRAPIYPLTEMGGFYYSPTRLGGGSKNCGYYGCGTVFRVTPP